MAQNLLEAVQISLPGADAAIPDIRVGGSTPAEQVMVWNFDGGTTDNYIDLLCRLSDDYDDTSNVTLRLPWGAETATTGNVRWGAAIRRVADDAEDIDAAHTYSYQEVTDAAPSASGEFTDALITFTNAQLDGWTSGELGIIRIRREASDTVNDTMAGNAQLKAYAVVLR